MPEASPRAATRPGTQTRPRDMTTAERANKRELRQRSIGQRKEQEGWGVLRRLRAWSGRGIHRRPRPPKRPSKRAGLRSIGLSRGVRASARRLERAHCAAGGWLCNSAAGCSPTSTHMRGRTAAHVRAHRTALHRHTRPHSHTHARGTRTELRGGPRFPFVHLAAGEPDTSAVLTTARPRPPWSPAHPEAPRQAPAAGLTSPFAHAHFAPPLAHAERACPRPRPLPGSPATAPAPA